MKTELIPTLNLVNNYFYHTIHQSFNSTRQRSWQGWQELLKLLEVQKLLKINNLKILDLACGNGRFLKFWQQNSESHFDYLGLDSSKELINFAKKIIKTEQNHKFQVWDSIQNGLNFSQAEGFNFNLITVFGFYHHLCNFGLRQKLFEQISTNLKPDGLAVVSAWKFVREKNIENKILNPASDFAKTFFKKYQLQMSDLEKNDYFLLWKRGDFAVRICHDADQTEFLNLAKEFDLKLVTQFQADGKERNLNDYFVLKKG